LTIIRNCWLWPNCWRFEMAPVTYKLYVKIYRIKICLCSFTVRLLSPAKLYETDWATFSGWFENVDSVLSQWSTFSMMISPNLFLILINARNLVRRWLRCICWKDWILCIKWVLPTEISSLRSAILKSFQDRKQFSLRGSLTLLQSGYFRRSTPSWVVRKGRRLRYCETCPSNKWFDCLKHRADWYTGFPSTGSWRSHQWRSIRVYECCWHLVIMLHGILAIDSKSPIFFKRTIWLVKDSIDFSIGPLRSNNIPDDGIVFL